MASIDELIVTDYSEGAEKKETSVAETQAIVNKTIENEDWGDISEEEPVFLFEFRGRPGSEISGPISKTKGIRPDKSGGNSKLKGELDELDKRAMQAKADKAKADK